MEQPAFRFIHKAINRSYTLKWEPFNLDTTWHYHPELELIYFVQGSASGIIADDFFTFEEGELVLLGEGFPHVLRRSPHQAPDEKPFGLIIQFREDFLGSDFLGLPESGPLRTLFENARMGLRFGAAAIEQVRSQLDQLPGLDESGALVALLSILFSLARSKAYRTMSNIRIGLDANEIDELKIRRVKEYVFQNFMHKISISDLSQLTCMTETSFCRYFKSRTLKSFTRFLIEVRVAYACRLLASGRHDAGSVCFASGFNNYSYFCRKFKEVMGKSPMTYQKIKASFIQPAQSIVN